MTKRSATSKIGLLLMAAVVAATGCREKPEEPVHTADPETVRRLPAGELVGTTTPDGAHAWFGIPFAQPPVGELRWRAPRPARPWAGRREALAFGASCVQFAGPGGGRGGVESGDVMGSEDCLYLNVYAPPFAPDAVPDEAARLPVMVWIHGGGNSVGDALLYDASLLATRQEVVVVTVHYRLGLLGWFSHPALRPPGTSPEDGSGNYGTLDLARSLAWIQENISGFGGDPERVVVFGESAGGSNVFSMLLSPSANGLFTGAIAQSGSAVTRSLAEAENFVDDPDPGDPASSNEVLLLHLLRDGTATDRASARKALEQMSPEEVASYLYAMSPAELLEIFDGNGFGGMYSSPELLRDGTVLPGESPVDAFRLGKYNQVPAILGTNRDEVRLFQLFTSPYVARFMRLPLWVKDVDLFQAIADHPSRMWKVRGTDAPASAMREVQGPSVYGYRFDWDDEPKVMMLDVGDALGAAHALEIPFVFGWLTLGPGTRFVFDDERERDNRWLSDQMMSYWSNFAYEGTPGRGRANDQARWAPWSSAAEGGETFMVLDAPQDGGVRMSTDAPLTREGVIAGVADDARLGDRPDVRCEVYRQLLAWGNDMTADEYARVEQGICQRDYPLADHPPTR
ncbi:MAG: carboxylesterase family protein [Myxococcota bacterium]|nr:carboxylesterase family protein [Myxococcota bacterium]